MAGLTLTAMGTPARGPTGSPRAILSSMALACTYMGLGVESCQHEKPTRVAAMQMACKTHLRHGTVLVDRDEAAQCCFIVINVVKVALQDVLGAQRL